MGLTIAQKIIKNHLVSGEMVPGTEIGLRIDQTLTQDATGTMAYLEFEAMGIDSVKTELSVAYIDHNTLQTGFENADDHRFIQSCAKKRGLLFSKPGNGICHQIHLERFGIPGKTLIGSDSHTPTGGGLGMIAIGAGGLDVAVREVERRHDRDTASEHHREPGADHEDRGCHVDGGKRVASHAAADEDAVRKVKDSREQEPQECRDKKPDKE